MHVCPFLISFTFNFFFFFLFRIFQKLFRPQLVYTFAIVTITVANTQTHYIHFHPSKSRLLHNPIYQDTNCSCVIVHACMCRRRRKNPCSRCRKTTKRLWWSTRGFWSRWGWTTTGATTLLRPCPSLTSRTYLTSHTQPNPCAFRSSNIYKLLLTKPILLRHIYVPHICRISFMYHHHVQLDYICVHYLLHMHVSLKFKTYQSLLKGAGSIYICRRCQKKNLYLILLLNLSYD